MSEQTVLIIDDDPNNIHILEVDLEDEGYRILTAEDGAKGWEVLQQHQDNISVILLDRMMPNMNGMEFMKKLKSDPSVSSIPVIMQTAAAEREQVAEGIQTGVYYYLTKPYDSEVMLSIVRAAIADYENLNQLQQDIANYTAKLHIIKEAYFKVSTLDDVRYLATFLSNFFPDPARVVLGLSELLLNAIEHGNLGITYEEKTQLLKENQWESEVIRRQQLSAHKDKAVHVHYKSDDHGYSVLIKDEGKGFDWQEFLELSPERATDPHGRGIALSRMMSFDEVEYIGNGSEVRCSIRL